MTENGWMESYWFLLFTCCSVIWSGAVNHRLVFYILHSQKIFACLLSYKHNLRNIFFMNNCLWIVTLMKQPGLLWVRWEERKLHLQSWVDGLISQLTLRLSCTYHFDRKKDDIIIIIIITVLMIKGLLLFSLVAGFNQEKYSNISRWTK